MHAAIGLGRRAQRYTAVSYHDLGETQTRTRSILCGFLCSARADLKSVRAGLSDLT